VPEIIKDSENGLIVEPDKVDALANAIAQFLSDRELARRCADNALHYAHEHFCFDGMMQAKLDVDLALIQQNKARVTDSKGAIPSSRTASPNAEFVSSDR